MIAALTNHLWQSTVVTALVALLSLALRHNRASVRHTLWMAASAKFLLPFSVLIALGGALSWRSADPAAASPAPPAVAAAVEQLTEPFPADDVPTVLSAAQRDPIAWRPIALATAWAAGALGVVAFRIRSWRRVRAAVRASVPLATSPFDRGVDVRATPGLLEPGIVGIWRPILLVPEGLQSALTADQLRAVLVHEQHHIDRRDNLTSAIHMVAEAVFWFHPLVWWIGARLIDERERACDEHVLAVGAAPEIYAEGILNVCKRYVESPLACVSGVTGADLKKRVGAILANRVGVRLDATRRIALGLAAASAIAAPIVAGAFTAPLRARQGPAATFDSASVRPCASAPAVTHGRGQKIDMTKNRLYLECFEVDSLIDLAYVAKGAFALGQRGLDRDVRGGPSWIHAERYTIEATAGGDPGDALGGSMLQALLEDRFQLRLHRVPEQVPMYALGVAKGGLKIAPLATGACAEFKPGDPPNAASDGTPYCGSQTGRDRNGVRIWDLGGVSLKALADILETDREVIDKTGVSGLFNIHLEYMRDPTRGASTGVPVDRTGTGAADVYAAVEEQLGLTLVSTTGPHEYFVVDQIERPTDGQSPAASTRTSAGTSKFDVVSVKPCDPNNLGGQGTRGQAAGAGVSAGRLTENCLTLLNLIQNAYIRFADGRGHDAWQIRNTPVEGGPEWIKHDPFMIEATTNASASQEMMRGPMLQSVLEDRFNLKLHRETRQGPIYELVVAAGGSKLTPAEHGVCVPPDWTVFPAPALPADQHYCSITGGPIDEHGSKLTPPLAAPPYGMAWDDEAISLDELTSDFLHLDRPVVNKTGIPGRFTFHLVHRIDRTDPQNGSPVNDAQTAARDLKEQLGLDLKPSTGPRESLVIDHVERPRVDGPAGVSTGAKGGGR